MKKTILISLLLIVSMTSCKKESQIEVFGNKTKKDFNQLKKASWFIGNWENISKEATFKEFWNKKNDSTYFAESIVIIKKDTVFYEQMDLFQKSDSLIMKISVKNQNKEKPVSFYLTKANENELVFENPKHDFPTKIVYSKITNDSIVGAIYGKKEGKEMSEIFPMKRTK